MNNELMRYVADVIEKTGRFDLAYYSAMAAPETDDANDEGDMVDGLCDLLHDCRTVGCVAGWVNALTGHSDSSDEYAAAQSLGITYQQSRRLFLGDDDSIWAELALDFGWPVRPWVHSDCDRYAGLADWSKITAEQAATVLRLIANGDVVL
jgi:hypothetical protein